MDNSTYPPGIVSTIARLADTPMDNATLDLQTLLTAELQDVTGEEPLLATISRGRLPAPPVTRPFIVSVDFDLIPDPVCRAWFFSLPTTWTLRPETVAALIEMGKALVRASPVWHDYSGKPVSKPDFSTACQAAWTHAPAK